jgi:hypothetical protein
MSCVGWAAGYTVRSFYARAWREDSRDWDPAVREEDRFSPSWVWRALNRGLNEPVGLSGAVWILTRYGAATWPQAPFTCRADQLPTLAAHDEALAHPLRTRAREYSSQTTVDERRFQLRRHLCCVGPVLAMLRVDTDFHLLRGEKFVRGVPDVVSRGPKAHALACVGYDDEIVMERVVDGDRVEVLGGFLVVNSWGECWGDHGRAWISYSDFDDMLVSACTIRDDKAVQGSEPVVLDLELPWRRDDLPVDSPPSLPAPGDPECEDGVAESTCDCREIPPPCPPSSTSPDCVVTLRVRPRQVVTLRTPWLPVVPRYALADSRTSPDVKTLAPYLLPLGPPVLESPLPGGFRFAYRLLVVAPPPDGFELRVNAYRRDSDPVEKVDRGTRYRFEREP